MTATTTTTIQAILDFQLPFFSRSFKGLSRTSLSNVASSNASLKAKKTRFWITCESTRRSRRFSVPAVKSSSSWTSATEYRTDDSDEQQSTEVRPYGNLTSDTDAWTLKHGYQSELSESAQIAQQYRLFQSLKEPDQVHQPCQLSTPFSSEEHPSCSASLSSSDMAGRNSYYESDEILDVRTQDAHLLHDMLCTVSPVIIDQTLEPASDDVTLSPYFEDPRNLIITSPAPELVPHLVISPPPEGDVFRAVQTDEYAQSRLQYLTREFLFVPPLFRSTCRMHTYQELLEDNPYLPSFPPPPHFCGNDVFLGAQCAQVTPVSRALDPPLPVFNRARLNDWITYCRQDENRWPSVELKSLLLLVRQKQMIMLFNEAAYKAIEFRERYDNPQYLDYIEASSQRLSMDEWIDPATPYLADIRENLPLTHIFESPDPKNIPHIAIHPATADDTDAAWNNAPPIQDCGEGQSLILISNPRSMTHTYINEPPWNPDFEWFVSRSQCIQYSLKRTYWDQWDEWNIEEDREYYFGDNCEGSGYFSDESSSPDSPGPQTPKSLYRLRDLDFLSDEDDDYVCDSQDSKIQSFDYAGVLPSPSSKSKFFIEDEDEDDGPPPFDEWFQQIAERNQLSVHLDTDLSVLS
ncbi:hypothetical protein CVT24_011487 [Panaeolus cyanescens]|uniref:Uncharacterized protein n=1 Tax=Panaeolus cyanescens TaxID=181874 RepID=A0A409VGJ0_9AGAR|nr:hypothetical protein CVT24_011487 [Panaeolus cyanescens]